MNSSHNRPPRPGKSRPRNRGKRGARGGGSSSKPAPPQVPQLKVTLRHVGNVDKYGSVENMMGLVKEMVARVNLEIAANHGNSSSTSTSAPVLPIQLDVGSMHSLIEAEKLVLERAEKEKMKEEETKEETAEENGGLAKEGADETGRVPMDVDAPAAADNSRVDYASAAKADNTMPAGPCIQASVLYAMPPKKSRRRDIKTGCAFLVLLTPSVMTNGSAVKAAASTSVPMSDANGTAMMTSTTTTTPAPLMTPAQRGRILALGRLQLRNALEALDSVAKLDTKSTNPQFAGCIVEESLNQKTWNMKQQKPDNRVGTIETTGDYMRFQEQQLKRQEERLSRPKPAPGGGVSAATIIDSTTDESGQPLAALVLHLRAKRERDARRKKKSTRVSNSNMDGRAKQKKEGGGGGKKDGKPKGEKSRPKKKKGGKGKSGDSSRPSSKPAKTMTLLDKAGIK